MSCVYPISLFLLPARQSRLIVEASRYLYTSCTIPVQDSSSRLLLTTSLGLIIKMQQSNNEGPYEENLPSGCSDIITLIHSSLQYTLAPGSIPSTSLMPEPIASLSHYKLRSPASSGENGWHPDEERPPNTSLETPNKNPADLVRSTRASSNNGEARCTSEEIIKALARILHKKEREHERLLANLEELRDQNDRLGIVNRVWEAAHVARSRRKSTRSGRHPTQRLPREPDQNPSPAILERLPML